MLHDILANGTQLGPYEIAAHIGAGGMGDVYRARDTRLNRFVALKTSQEKYSERFEREMRAIAALSHPNVCTLHDVGPNYLVMELLEGKTLAAVLQNRRLPIDETLHVAAQIASALEAAHAKGLVHRDIKPGNVFLSPKGLVKVLDFGLAKLTASVAGEILTIATDVSQAGQAMGTVAYMSPEQARGEGLDARSDLWSLGVVLYEMLTGSRPFEGPTHAVTFNAIFNKTPTLDLQSGLGIGPELGRLVGKLLEKDRDLRYQSAADLLADLKRIERAGSSGTSFPGVSEFPPVPARRRWIPVTAAVVVLASISAGIWYWRAQTKPQVTREGTPIADVAKELVDSAVGITRPRLTREDRLVVADFVNKTGDSVFDGTLREALATKLQQSKLVLPMSPDQVRTKLAEMRLDPDTPVTPKLANQICIRSNQKATLSGSIAALGSRYALILTATDCQTGEVLSTAQAQADGKEKVLDALSEAVDTMRTELGERLAQAQQGPLGKENIPLTTASIEAFQSYAAGMKPFSLEQYADAVPHFRRAHEIDPEFTYAILIEGLSAGNAGNGAEMNALYKKAYKQRKSASEIERLVIEAEYSWVVEGDREKARGLFEQVLQLAPSDGLALNELAGIYRTTGNVKRASELHEQMLQVAPTMQISYGELTDDYITLDRFAEARQVLAKAVKEKVTLPGMHELLQVVAYMEGDLATAEKEAVLMAQTDERRALNQQMRYALATGRFREGDALSQRSGGGSNKPTRVYAEDCSGLNTTSPVFLLLCGEGERAAQQAEQNLANSNLDPDAAPGLRAIAALGRGKPQQAVAVLNALVHVEVPNPQNLILSGRAHMALKQPAEAAKEFRKVIARKSNLFDVLFPLAHVELARALTAAGDKAGARQAYDAFFKLWKNADRDIPLLVNARKEYAALQ